jgi:hypothetical protein
MFSREKNLSFKKTRMKNLRWVESMGWFEYLSRVEKMRLFKNNAGSRNGFSCTAGEMK